MRLTIMAKILIILIVIGAGAALLRVVPGLVGHPTATQADPGETQASNVPPKVVLTGKGLASGERTAPRAGGCPDLPPVRLSLPVWNAQLGLIYANGGKRAAAGSLMCEHKVNLELVREDSPERQAQQLANGTEFAIIHGDTLAAFLVGLGSGSADLQVVAAAGFSRGDDEFLGPEAWAHDPTAARGGVAIGVLREADWNIALKWLGDNSIANNPVAGSYDPDALNWVGAVSAIEAARRFVKGECVELRNVKTHETGRHCLDAVGTNAPGVVLLEQKAGLASIVSTGEYRFESPAVLLGHRDWMAAHRDTVTGLLAAMVEGGDALRSGEAASAKAFALSAEVYGEPDVAPDPHRARLEGKLGSEAADLADNQELFGIGAGATDVFGIVYRTFGDLARSQYPTLVGSFPPPADVVDASYLGDLVKHGEHSRPADLARFTKGEKLGEVVSKRNWKIEFASGSAGLLPETTAELTALLEDLVLAGSLVVELHGHTDGQGTLDENQRLSEARAFAVKSWLEAKAPHEFPEGRVRVVAFGMTRPIAPNATAEGRARNRRVEVLLGEGN